ncbi:tripartite tricarboxylate transporter TctB family protein [Devosia sp.]|uniref:tripartite tricarboxylate transporter TctB family protein n=1 Tax=Devosia sp. TaxID=1871048 RepID=UPI002733FC48|nr:tripartite tricarboxylate transporter TctB family protein [Devosia sp.]MDP2779286.1 tripartite tricarboxylate transporter TctB family protein [Devosia sp.]
MSAWSKLQDKDVLSGAIFAGVGVWFTVQSLNLSMGSARSMGPGYLPTALSLLLLAFGVAILVRGVIRGVGPVSKIPLRGLVAVIAALLIFAFCVRGAGLVPTVFVVVLVTCLGSTRAQPLPSVLLAGGVAIFCWAAFIWGLGLPLSMIGPWLGGY